MGACSASTARVKLRPMRPKPLMPTRMVIGLLPDVCARVGRSGAPRPTHVFTTSLVLTLGTSEDAMVDRWERTRPPTWVSCAHPRSAAERNREMERLTAQEHVARVRRVSEEPIRSDGARVLVDRIWPRGLRLS